MKSLNARSPLRLEISNCIVSQDNFETDRSFTDENNTPWEQSGRDHHHQTGVANLSGILSSHAHNKTDLK
jgi:hypothetical protein